jgi:hypothetical protein
MEDLSGLIFFDEATSPSGSLQCSGGVELHLEIKSVINIDLGIRHAYNKESWQTTTFFVKGCSPFDIDLKR